MSLIVWESGTYLVTQLERGLRLRLFVIFTLLVIYISHLERFPVARLYYSADKIALCTVEPGIIAVR